MNAEEPDESAPWSALGDASWRADYFEDALEPEVRELAEFMKRMPLGALHLVALRDRLDEMVKAVKDEPRQRGAPAGRGLRKKRERRLAEREAGERRWLGPSDFEAIALQEADERVGGGTLENKVKDLSRIYRSMRPHLPKNSVKTAINSE